MKEARAPIIDFCRLLETGMPWHIYVIHSKYTNFISVSSCSFYSQDDFGAEIKIGQYLRNCVNCASKLRSMDDELRLEARFALAAVHV